MGLIKAAFGALGGNLADQWKDFFSCDSIDDSILAVKGRNTSSKRSSNTKGEENVISDGAGIVVADGQCMIIVEQGKVIELCAEPGIYTYNNDLTPSIFLGNLKANVKESIKETVERFKFGGGVGKDQRIYYFNIKEIYGNKYGTINPVPFKVIIDKTSGKSLGIDLRCNGEYSYKIVNPLLFYTNVCGNVENIFSKYEIESQMRSELLRALQPALAKIALMNVDYSEIPLYTDTIADNLNEELSKEWTEKRGIEIISFGMNSVSVSDDDKIKIQNLQQAIMMSDPNMAAGNLVQAQADAMRDAANNRGGTMTGFMGMGLASTAGGVNVAELFEMNSQKNVRTIERSNPENTWVCKCGATSSGKFCMECGSPKPINNEVWVCKCGATSSGKFCMECGSPKPNKESVLKCSSCGWELSNANIVPKFCPECGKSLNL